MSNGYDDERGAGWVLFAGVMVAIAGVMNVVGGIAAIDSANFFTSSTHFMISDLNTWGWIILVIGILQLFAAFSVWSGGEYGRWVGVGSASLNAVAQLIFIAAFPLWSLAIFAIDILVIYGLVVYGGRHGAAGDRTAV
jgi:hypothetical protein